MFLDFDVDVVLFLHLLSDNLPDDCQLRGGVYFVDSDLPKTRTGKPNRVLIKEQATKLYKSKLN